MTTCYVDEVGVASIAGPAVVCAIAIDDGQEKIEGVKDSKKLSREKRNFLAPKIKAQFEYSIKEASIKRIEEINIHWAKYEAMKDAIIDLSNRGINVTNVIVDGKFQIPDLDFPQEAVVKADDKFWQVGAASIVAKVYRDDMMAELADQYEQYSYYDWQSNAGYYTPKHRMGIILHGPCDLHRKTFVYFKYCLQRHNEFETFIKNGGFEEDFFQKEDPKKSDYHVWKESKKNFWKPILPE